MPLGAMPLRPFRGCPFGGAFRGCLSGVPLTPGKSVENRRNPQFLRVGPLFFGAKLKANE
jgi:hypothetical protein